MTRDAWQDRRWPVRHLGALGIAMVALTASAAPVDGSEGRSGHAATVRPSASSAPSTAIQEFPASSLPRDLTVGPDGNVWYTEPVTATIVRLTPAGTPMEFPVLPVGPAQTATVFSPVQPQAIVTGPDGNLWFTNYGQTGGWGLSPSRISSNGTVAFVTSASPEYLNATGAYPIVASGQNLWLGMGPDVVLFSAAGTSVGQMRGTTVAPGFTPLVYEYDDICGYEVTALAPADGGGVWFALAPKEDWSPSNGAALQTSSSGCSQPGIVGHVSTDGSVGDVHRLGSGSEVLDIAADGSGGIWLSEASYAGDAFYRWGIGHLSTGGDVHEFAIAVQPAIDADTVWGPLIVAKDGSVWFARSGSLAHQVTMRDIRRIDMCGNEIAAYPSAMPRRLAQGPDGSIWFTESGPTDDRGSIGRIAPGRLDLPACSENRIFPHSRVGGASDPRPHTQRMAANRRW